MPAVRDSRTRPASLLTTRDPRPRPTVGLGLSTTRSSSPPQHNASAPIHLRPETPPLSLASPSPPSVSYSQIVTMDELKWPTREEVKNMPLDTRFSERKWLTREEVKKLPKIPKTKCGALATPTSASVPESKSSSTTSTPVTKMPLTLPGYPFALEQQFDSPGFEKTRPCTSTSATQTETSMNSSITPQWSSSTGPKSTHATSTNAPPCSQSSPGVSLPVTAPSTPTTDFASLSLSGNVGAFLPSSMKSSANLQERDRLDIPRGRNGVQALSQMKETKESPRTQNAIPDLQDISPLKNAIAISSQVQRSSPLASTVMDSDGRTTQRIANSPNTPVTSTQQTRSRKEFDMDSYDSCNCRSNGGPECDYCRILKRVSEFCKRVDRAVKGS